MLFDQSGGTMKERTWIAKHPWLAAAMAVLCVSAAGAARAQSVAIVTDVSGKVAAQAPVTILAEIAADARLKLEPGSRLVVVYVRSGDEYTLTGPAQVRFRAGGPEVASGAKPQRKANPLGKDSGVTIRPLSVAQGAFVMRSGRPTARIKLLSLSGTKTLEAAPEFRWQEIEPGAKYRFELTDDTGKSLYEGEVGGAAFRLPAGVQLREGVSYTWELSARLGDGKRYVSAGDFSVAAGGVRSQARSLRPAAGAPVSQRVAYAAWLEQMELRDEARKYWKALATERPEDGKLKMLAAE
jgi:hypothetical protein